MSFPSVSKHLKPGVTYSDALWAAVEEDCPESMALLRQVAARVSEAQPGVFWRDDPNSVRGKNLLRIFASTPVSNLVRKRIFGDLQHIFLNCCGGIVGELERKEGEEELSEEELLAKRQIEAQDGTIANTDC